MKIYSHSFILVSLLSMILIGCTASPRFCPGPIVQKKDNGIKDEKTQKTEEAQTEYSEKQSSLDKGKMGKIIVSYLGIPYQRGGETKAGMDCSGLVVAVYRQYSGFKLPHDTNKLFKLVKRIHKENLEYGDLVFFSDGGSGVMHVGIYIDEGRFVHSLDDFGVIVSSLKEDYYKKKYIGARRVIP